MSDTIDTLRADMARIHGRYSAYFAGQPRISRDPTLLDKMLEELGGLGRQAEALSGPSRAVFGEELGERRGLYEREAAAIREAQAEGPDAFLANHLSSWTDFTIARYRRHFAGKNRATRDLGLLTEIHDELDELDGETTALAQRYRGNGLERARERVQSFLTLCAEERKKIAEARLNGGLQDQADALAGVANEQFRLYRAHFAGKSRLSRRPALLARMVSTLADLRERMEMLQQQGLHSEHNDRNLEIVKERQAAYTDELAQVRQAKQQAGLSDLVRGLGEAANGCFEQYRTHFAGKDRQDRDLGLLVDICDALYDLGRQMEELDRVRAEPQNEDNLHVVMDQLRLYEREYALIEEAKAAPA